MASHKTIQERVQALVSDLLAEELEREDELIDDIEEALVELGDAVAREFAGQKLARHMRQAAPSSPCPHCQHPGERVGERRRDLLTRRGEVPIREAQYRCPKCRRHFFPSDRASGD